VRDDLRDYVVEHLGDAASGVARQYTGTASDTVNCQVGVFLAYASPKGAAFIDRALYLPRAWTGNGDRRVEAGIPSTVGFTTKIGLASQMLARAFNAAVPARWVVADSFYGRSGAFRRWLEERARAYAVMIPRTNAIQYQGQRIRVEQLAKRLPGQESSGWRCLTLSEECAGGMGRWLLIRHDPDDPSKDVYWLVYGPEGTSDEALIEVCNTRWQVEEGHVRVEGVLQ